MSSATGGAPSHATVAPVAPVGGTVRVRPRALEKAVRAASADLAGAPRDGVSVDIAEWGGGLTIRVATKLPIPGLEQSEEIRHETPIFERVRAMQIALAEELARLTGRDIRRVSVTVTGAIVPERKRVR
ncbi:NTP pyrophosphohydrolase [Leucobacter albus]|uniref:NTP pyrophosphohydrolase n=1 Tax=Leucobacter albus TaxID=272210 RepID=A0ABW3TNN1_9MICO